MPSYLLVVGEGNGEEDQTVIVQNVITDAIDRGALLQRRPIISGRVLVDVDGASSAPEVLEDRVFFTIKNWPGGTDRLVSGTVPVMEYYTVRTFLELQEANLAEHGINGIPIRPRFCKEIPGYLYDDVKIPVPASRRLHFYVAPRSFVAYCTLMFTYFTLGYKILRWLWAAVYFK
ncbi:hypothetical protein H0H93_012061 [Arthromyces matolae]|nr:hypothetical protein H0H93_012061 [Arthromyces matolae]